MLWHRRPKKILGAGSLRSYPRPSTRRTLVHAFVTNRVAYCNCLLCETGVVRMRRRPSIQNAAVRLVTNTFRRYHITPVLCQLHCLLICQLIQYKIAMFVFKALHGLTLPYLATVYLAKVFNFELINQHSAEPNTS